MLKKQDILVKNIKYQCPISIPYDENGEFVGVDHKEFMTASDLHIAITDGYGTGRSYNGVLMIRVKSANTGTEAYKILKLLDQMFSVEDLKNTTITKHINGFEVLFSDKTSIFDYGYKIVSKLKTIVLLNAQTKEGN